MRHKTNPIARKMITKKWLIILLASALLTMFGRALNTTNLSQSAIIIGLGIDYQNEEFIVTTQSVSETGNTAGAQVSQSYINCTAKSKTIMDAFLQIGRKLGLVISLSHCNIIILTPSVLALDYTQLIYPLLMDLMMPDEAVVISTPEDPSKLLAQPVATQDNTVFLAQATLVQNLRHDGLASVTIKDFLADGLSLSGAVRLPYTRIVKPSEQPISTSQSDTEYVELVMTENLIVKDDKAFVLSSELSQALNLFLLNNAKNILQVEMPSGGRFVFRIVNKSGKTEINGLKVSHNAKLTVSFIEVQMVESNEILDCTSDIVKEAASFLAKKLEIDLMRCFEMSKTENVDFLKLQNKVYQKVGRSLKADCLQDIDFDVTYEIKVKENKV